MKLVGQLINKTEVLKWDEKENLDGLKDQGKRERKELLGKKGEEGSPRELQAAKIKADSRNGSELFSGIRIGL